MRRYLLAAIVMGTGIFLLTICKQSLAAEGDSTLPARLQMPNDDLLPFWEIPLTDFKAEKPQAYSLPTIAGKQYNYWIWKFRFRPKTTLEYVEKRIKEIETMDGDNAEIYQSYLRRIDKAEAATEVMDGLRVVIHSDTGRVLADISDVGVRNTLEKRERKRYYTVDELTRVPMSELKTKAAATGGWIQAVAIFPWIEASARHIEIRVYGLGRHFSPAFQPNALIKLRHPSLGASFRRALRFGYCRLGNSGRPATDAIIVEQEKVKADWIWLWASQVKVGKFRKLEVKRHSGLSREYLYLPYWIHNDTHLPQALTVLEAGLRVRIQWQGEMLEVRMPDIGEADDQWKTQVLRIIEKNVGSEENFVKSQEISPNAVMTAKVEQDIATKKEITPKGKKRHFAGTIPAGKLVRGLMIVRFGTDNLEDLVDYLITRLRSRALTMSSDEHAKKGSLLASYLAIRPKLAAGTPRWMSAPEPNDRAIIQLLLKHAQAELNADYADNAIPSAEEARRYNTLKYSALTVADIKDWNGFCKKLAASSQAKEASPGKHIWGFIAKWAQARILTAAGGDALEKSEKSALILALNGVLRTPGVYDPKIFAATKLCKAGQEIAARDLNFLSRAETRRLNRYALEAVYPELIEKNLDLAVLGHLLSLKAAAKMNERAKDKDVVDVFFAVKWDGVFDQASFPSSFRRALPKNYPPFKVKKKRKKKHFVEEE